ncbi:MAG: response regulator, partial [Nitrospinota bacterium]
MARILVASGDAGLRKQLSRHLAERGHEVVAAGSAQSALAKLREGGFDLALADLGMSSKGEGELCRRLVEAGSETAVVVLAAAEEEGRAREAVEGGAFDVLERPPSLPRLEGVLRRAREAHELRTQLRQAREEMERANRALAERERRLEEATETLLRREKMELLHRMASFLAHDLKNSVAVLSLVVENAARQMGNPAFLRDAFEAIAHHVGRMQRLVGLLTHLRPGAPMRFAQVDVNELLARVCQVSGLEEEGRVELQKRLSPLPAVEGDPAAL